MSRPIRIEFAGAFYHVTARGNERKKIFLSQRDYARFKEYLEIARERFGCVLHAYVLMGNHYHLLLETPEANLSKVMHYLNGTGQGDVVDLLTLCKYQSLSGTFI